MNFLSQYVDSFLENQGASMIKAFLGKMIVIVVGWLHFQGMVTPSTAQAWAATVTAAVITFLTHWVDQHFNNSNAAPAPAALLQVSATDTNTQQPTPTATTPPKA